MCLCKLSRDVIAYGECCRFSVPALLHRNKTVKKKKIFAPKGSFKRNHKCSWPDTPFMRGGQNENFKKRSVCSSGRGLIHNIFPVITVRHFSVARIANVCGHTHASHALHYTRAIYVQHMRQFSSDRAVC